MKSANTAVLAITQIFTAHSGRNTTRRRGSIFSQRGGSERLPGNGSPPGTRFLLAAKESSQRKLPLFRRSGPRLRGCTPLRTPIRKSEGPTAKRTQYYCPFLTPSGLPPLLSRVFPRTPAFFNGCFVGAAYMSPATYRGNPLTCNLRPLQKGRAAALPCPSR